MDRARLGEPDAPPPETAAVAGNVGDPLADEMRHSALLLGWALGLMGTVAVLLLVLTTRFGG
jgi:hypothetical protein